MTHICVGIGHPWLRQWPIRCQAIISTNIGLLLILIYVTNFSLICFKIWNSSCMKIIENISCKTVNCFVAASCVNSLRPSNFIWRLRSGWTLARIIACCLPTPSHHPSKCWHIINGDPQHSPGDNFTGMLKIRVYKMNSVIDFCHISQGSICQRKQSTIQWRHNELDSVSNHQPYDCLFNCLFRRRPKKTSKLRVTGLCVGNSPMTGEFPTQRASNAENIFIWWRHHDLFHWACYIHWQSVQVNVG